MNDNEASITKLPIRRPPWNKGKLVGAKPPLRPSHVWSIRTKLQLGERKRDLGKRGPNARDQQLTAEVFQFHGSNSSIRFAE